MCKCKGYQYNNRGYVETCQNEATGEGPDSGLPLCDNCQKQEQAARDQREDEWES